MPVRTVGVIDIGTSSAKLSVVDLDTQAELDTRKIPVAVLGESAYPHYDVAAIWDFVLEAITELNREHPLDALSVAAAGGIAALIDETGELTLPVLDPDYAGPDALARGYDSVRPEFAESFTPRLPAGLNLGAQLYWQERSFPAEFARTRWILPYAQYWGFRLTGTPCSEITSLGCHTDLWNFETDLYSSLVVRQGWLEKMPDVRPADEVLGIVKPELCRRLGLKPRVPVHVGIEQSSALLLPHMVGERLPFSVVSTGGPWVVASAPGGSLAGLDPDRDCFANLDAFGRPVPVARFMGGAEFSQMIGEEPAHIGEAAVARVLDESIMLLPSVTAGSGPFPNRKARWTHPEHTLDKEARFVAVSFYLALMTAECLALTGADGTSVVEGTFTSNRLYLEMLAPATERAVEAMPGGQAGVSLGAALLARMKDGRKPGIVVPFSSGHRLAGYAAKWRAALG